MPIDKTERLLNLIAALQSARRPLSADQIRTRVDGYPDGDESFHRAFERDKADLMSSGFPLETVPTETGFGYQISTGGYQDSDMDLSDEERTALRFAAESIRFEGLAVTSGLAKLGGAPNVQRADTMISMGLPRPPALLQVFEGLVPPRLLHFTYKNIERSVRLGQLRFRDGYWYLEAFDETRGEPRIFRLDRVEGDVTLGDPTDGLLQPSERSSTIPWLEFGDDRTDVKFWADAEIVETIRRDLPSAHIDVNEDGSALIEVSIANWTLFRAYLLDHLQHVRLVSPSRLVDQLVEWLTSCVSGPTQVQKAIPSIAADHWWGDSDIAADHRSGAPAAAETSGSRKKRETAVDRVTSILAIVPWVMSHPGVSLDEIGARFQRPPTDIHKDLTTASLTGVYPYTPDALLDVRIDEGRIWITAGEFYSRPLSLDASQACALIIVGKSALAVPGSDPNGTLARAIDKLSKHVVGTDGEMPIAVELGRVEAGILETIKNAVSTGAQLEVDYYTAARDTSSTRVVTPQSVNSRQGQLYVDVLSHDEGQVRTFRLDRIHAVRQHQPAKRATDEAMATSGGTTRTLAVVELVLRPDQFWVIDSNRTESVVDIDSGHRVARLPVAGEAWLGRLLLRLGGDVEIRGETQLTTAGSRYATKILSLYSQTDLDI